MKIKISLDAINQYTQLRDYEDGKVVRLDKRINTKSEVTDPILLVDMQNYSLYRYGGNYNPNPGDHYQQVARMNGKRVILNLATGRLSCVDNSRFCTEINAEIHTS